MGKKKKIEKAELPRVSCIAKLIFPARSRYIGGNLRLGAVRWLVQGHSWDSNPGRMAPESQVSDTLSWKLWSRAPRSQDKNLWN